MPGISTRLIEALLLGPEVAETSDVAAWWAGEQARLGAQPLDPFERALAGGAAADRLGWAMASGYQASLAALVPGLPAQRPAAFCVSEADGNAPRAIRTKLSADGNGWRLDGEKRWSTLGPVAGTLLIAARETELSADGRASIRLVQVAGDSDGLSFEPMPGVDFVPEVPHARVQLDGVRVSAEALFAGDAYQHYVKPFRTVEDIHVNAAMLAYLLAEAGRRNAPTDWRERAASLLMAQCALALEAPSAASTHIALTGVLSAWSALVQASDAWWGDAPNDASAQRWHRDKRLLGLAGRTRALRAQRAWEQLDSRQLREQ